MSEKKFVSLRFMRDGSVRFYLPNKVRADSRTDAPVEAFKGTIDGFICRWVEMKPEKLVRVMFNGDSARFYFDGKVKKDAIEGAPVAELRDTIEQFFEEWV